MNFYRKTTLLVGALTLTSLMGFQTHQVSPVGSWILVKGHFLDEKKEVTLNSSVVSQTKDGPVIKTKSFKSRALMTKAVSFSGQGEYTETRSGIAVDAKNPAGTADYPFVKYDSPWNKASFTVVNEKTLKLVSHDGASRTVQFHVDGDKLTLVEGKNVEIYVKALVK